MPSTPTWRTRAADVTKPDYRQAVPQNTAKNIQTPRSNREIVAQLESRQK